MTSALRRILFRLDRQESPAFTAAEVKQWPPGFAESLVEAGLLRPIAPADSLVCDSCPDRCVITPDLRKRPGTGETVGVWQCSREDCGRVTVDLKQLQQWEPSLFGLADLLAARLGLSGSVLTIVDNRILWLGSFPSSDGNVDVFLGRGLRWADAGSLVEDAGRLASATHRVLIVVADWPVAHEWTGLRLETTSLAELAVWDSKTSRCEIGAIKGVLQATRRSGAEQWLSVTECAELLTTDIDGLTLSEARARVSGAATRGRFLTNGKTWRERRIEPVSFDAWRLRQRERDLDSRD